MTQENAIQALKLLVSAACDKPHAQRINALLDLGPTRGHKKFLRSLQVLKVRDGHAIPFKCNSAAPAGPCFIFSLPGDFEFGEASPSFAEALEQVSWGGEWLLVSTSGLIGIHQPDDFVDDRILIRAVN